MTFGELIDGLGKNLGIELTDEGGATAVEVDGIPVVLHAANDDLLLIHADLGEIAPESRERVFAAAMEANFLYQGTGGSTLAVDSRDGHLHLQKYNWFDRLDAEKSAAAGRTERCTDSPAIARSATSGRCGSTRGSRSRGTSSTTA